jgi:hypothetical protein
MRLAPALAITILSVALISAQPVSPVRAAEPLTQPGTLERQARRPASFESLRPLRSVPPALPQTDGRPTAEYRVLR